MKRRFIDWQPRRQAVRDRLEQASAVIGHWSALGYRLTLRQLYYQLVSRGAIGNTVKEYKNLSVTMTNARMAGLIDWDHIEDRSRNALVPSHWSGASHILQRRRPFLPCRPLGQSSAATWSCGARRTRSRPSWSL